MIIAEIGLNHLGSKKYVDKYVEALLNTEVNAVSIQVREPEYYREKFHLLLKCDIYLKFIKTLHLHGKKAGIAIGDTNVVDFFEGAEIDFYKVIRNDINNYKLIDRLRATKKEIIVSTGMSSEKDIDKFINHIDVNRDQFKLNHTQLSYDIKDCNLSAIPHMKHRYNMKVSFGLHADNHNVLYMALAYKPSDILFYVKLDEDLNFPDSRHAISLKNVGEVVNNLKSLPFAAGNGLKVKMENRMK